MALTKVSYSMIEGSPVNVLDFGAVGDGLTSDSAAFQLAVNAAIATTGEVFVPAGTYLIDASIYIPFAGGVKISGTSTNSLATRSLMLQKSIETPVFDVDAINFTMTGLSFTTWAGNTTELDGTPITCLSVTSNSMTLSANPWPGVTPIVWTTLAPQISTDGTPYSNVVQISINGSFYASSVTVNPNGTVTLNGVKGANGTLNAELANLVGDNVGAFVSLAHISTAPVNPEAGTIYLSVKENHFYDKLWFNQVTSAFTVSALGSGSGPGVGVGSIGFMSDIMCDQATYFMRALGTISSLQINNSQFYGIQGSSFYAPFGSIEICTFSNNQVIIGKFIQANSDIYGCTIVGNNFNAISGFGYSDFLINIGGAINESTIVGNNFGRSTDTVINCGSVTGSTLTGNNITSTDEGGSQPWLYVATNVTNSYLGGNNFASLYTSGNNRLGFVSATPSVAGSTFGGDFVGFQTGTKVVGFLPVTTFLNSWANVGGGTPAVQYFKDLNGIVTVYGSLAGGSAGTIAFQLPPGYRPATATNRFLGGLRYDGANEVAMFVTVDNSGNVTLIGTVVSYSNLNLSFPTR